MSGTVLGLHQNEWHNDHLTYIREEQPTADLILDPSDGEAAAVKGASPQTIVITRFWEDDNAVHNEYLNGDPVAAGRWWAAKILSNAGRLGKYSILINEPPCTVEALARQAQAEIAFMKALDADGRGFKAGIGAFSGGNLQHPSIDGGAEIRAYEPALRYAKEHGHALFIHLYFVRPAMGGATPSGLVYDPRDLALRWTQSLLPWMRANNIPIPDIHVTEFGLDLGFARDLYGFTGEAQGVGWKSPAPWGYGDSEAGARQYASDLIAVATAICHNAPEIKSLLLYCAGDNGTHKWRSFMVDGYLLHHLATLNLPTATQPQQPPATPPPTPPPTVERVRLRIPYASQLAPVDQANYGVGDCLQAVITQLARASGRVVTVNDVARLTGLPRGYLSSHIITHGVNVARQLGIRLLWAGRLEPEDLKEEIRAGRSVILRVWYPFLMKRFDMNYSQYHFITVHGFEGDKFFYDDPYWRKQSDGEDIAITAAQLRRAAWRAAGGATPAQGLLVRSLELPKAEAA